MKLKEIHEGHQIEYAEPELTNQVWWLVVSSHQIAQNVPAVPAYSEVYLDLMKKKKKKKF